MSFEQAKTVWMNGELVPWLRANFHVSAHALHYGSGVFEGIRCYETSRGPAVFRLDEHMQRFFASAKVYGMDIPYTPRELGAAVCQTIEANGFRHCYVRPIAFFGSGSLGLDPRKCPLEVAVLAWPWPAFLAKGALESGVRVTVSPWQKFHSRMMPATAKACGQYLNSILAVRDATGRGFDEALLLDSDGGVAEGSGENVFCVRDGVLTTNDERHSILMGITRDAVLEIARDLGIPVRTSTLTLEDVMLADEAFFTGTAAEVTPIRELDGMPVGAGCPGPITKAIQRAFFDITAGRSQRDHGWLHYVDDCTFAGAYCAVPCI
jgi:branched-chain amino acid aminotransferase